MGRYSFGRRDHASIVPGRVAAILAEHAGLERWRLTNRGIDAQVDEVLLDLYEGAVQWRLAHGYEAELLGTPTAARSEPLPVLEGWCSTRDAANRLNVKTTQAVLKLIRLGHLEGEQGDRGRWRVRISSLDELVEARNWRRTG